MRRKLGVGLVVLCLVAAACGGYDDTSTGDEAQQPATTNTEDTDPTPEPTATTTPSPTATPEPESDPTTTAAPEPTPEVDLSALVDLSIECTRGAQLSALPVDAQLIGFLEGQPDDTAWTTQVVTITNRSEVPAAVAPGFVVRYLNGDGGTLGEEDFDEPFPPALFAAPGQTVHRNIVRFDVPGVAGPVRDADLAEQVFAELDSCEIANEVVVAPAPVDELIDAELADQVELISCGLNATGDRYEGVLRVDNPADEPLSLAFGFEIVDGQGDRLGIGGNDRDRVDPSSQTDITGWAASFTVFDIEAADDCVLFDLSAG